MGDGGSSLWFAVSHGHVEPPGILLVVLTVAAIWIMRTRWSPHSRLCVLLAGLIGAGLLLSDVQSLALMNYSVHMFEHLVVILVIAPLIATSTSLRWSRPASTLGFVAFTGVIPLFHLTRLGGMVMRSPLGHDGELLSFLLVGVAFWIPVYGAGTALSERERRTYVLLALPVVATTGLVLWSSSVASLGVTSMNMSMVSLATVHSGGVVMMAWGSAFMAVHLLVLTGSSVLEHRRHYLPVGERYA